jgi:aminocarboxymuconate-semialdehyde decarboxylase
VNGPLPTAVDAHVHVIVPELLRSASAGEGADAGWRPSVFREGDQQVVELAGRRIRSAVQEFVDLDEILRSLEQVEIGRVVLCPWVPLLFYDIDPSEGLERCRLQNLGLARRHERRPERVRVLGAVPLQDPELAAAELHRLMAIPGFGGVEVTASVNGDYLGDPRFEPFWEAAAGAGRCGGSRPGSAGVRPSV